MFIFDINTITFSNGFVKLSFLFNFFFKFLFGLIILQLQNLINEVIFNSIIKKINFAFLILLLELVELLFEYMQILLHSAVPVVLDAIISPAWEYFGDVGPLAAVGHVVQIEDPLLFLAQLRLVDLRVQVVVPPFATLFPHSSRQERSDLRPFVRTVFMNQF